VKAWVHTKCKRPDGSFDSFCTHRVKIQYVLPVNDQEDPYYTVLWNSRWWRVRTKWMRGRPFHYLGKKYDECLTVQTEPEIKHAIAP
jgi:hypothetical protein